MTVPSVIPDAISGLNAFLFDVCTSEMHESTAEPTEYPVELGADITDHVRVKADQVTLVGIITMTPVIETGGGAQLQQTIDVPTFEPPINSFASAISALGDFLFGPPPPIVITSLIFPTPFDPISDAHNLLLSIKSGRFLCEVITSTVDYTDMILTSVTMNKKDDEQAAEFTLAFKQITTVETSTVAAPKPLIPAGKPPVSAGSQGTTEPPAPIKSTLAKTLTDSGTSGVTALLAGGL